MQEIEQLIYNFSNIDPFSRFKLYEAWDGLSVESKIIILDLIRQKKPRFHEALLKSVDDPNPMVRHKSALLTPGYASKYDIKTKMIWEKMKNDKSPLVSKSFLKDSDPICVFDNNYLGEMLNNLKFYLSEDGLLFYPEDFKFETFDTDYTGNVFEPQITFNQYKSSTNELNYNELQGECIKRRTKRHLLMKAYFLFFLLTCEYGVLATYLFVFCSFIFIFVSSIAAVFQSSISAVNIL